tara:strand:- start:50 stop:664 length:615 start_codon:yes stop_codon:yes gene_type:complete
MKNTFYIAVIALMILIASVFLILYYTQEFEENFRFASELDYAQLEIQESTKGGERYLNSAKGNLGSLELINSKGLFPQVYVLPRLVGCIDLKEGTSFENSKIRNYKFDIQYVQEGVNYWRNNRVEIPIGKMENFDLVGEYKTYNVPFEAFTSENIESISIYKMPKDLSNPLNEYDSYRIRNRGSGDNCNSLRTSLNPEKVILLK